jgi:UDP-arabinose 4-epimerase
MKILVTGGAGYIGSHTAKALRLAGMEPVVFDNLSAGHRWAVQWGPLHEGDLADRPSIEAALDGVDGVVHFAAHAYVGESMLNPGKYFSNNVAGTLNLLEAMRARGVKTIVFSSSCATYGIPGGVPISEQEPQKPINPYGESKLMAERLLQWYGEIHGIHWMALRYFNAAGADPDEEIGEVHDPETHLIPLAIEAALGNRDFLEVYGVDYQTKDGTASRDYVHVSDLADAHVKALRVLAAGHQSLALNLGAGVGRTVREVVTTIEAQAGREVPIRECRRRPGDPAELVADAAKAKEVLGWEPKFSSLESIVKTALKWHSDQAPARRTMA